MSEKSKEVNQTDHVEPCPMCGGDGKVHHKPPHGYYVMITSDDDGKGKWKNSIYSCNSIDNVMKEMNRLAGLGYELIFDLNNTEDDYTNTFIMQWPLRWRTTHT